MRSVITANISYPHHIANFFAAYPRFLYDPSQSFLDEFYRMCDHFHWRRNSQEKQVAREALHTAMVLQFNDVYGTDPNDLGSWQTLCQVIGMSPPRATLSSCRSVRVVFLRKTVSAVLKSRSLQAVLRSHVNICDLLDAPLIGRRPQRFSSELELSRYTNKRGRYFPKDHVYAGSLLKYLLRNIYIPKVGTEAAK